MIANVGFCVLAPVHQSSKEIKTILSAAELARDNLRDTHFALKELTAAVVASVEYKAFLEKVTMDHNEL